MVSKIQRNHSMMFKKIGLVIILIMFTYLANCVNTPLGTNSKHPNQPKGEDMIIVNGGKQHKTSHPEDEKLNLNQQENISTNITSRQRSSSTHKTQQNIEKKNDKDELKFESKSVLTQSKDQNSNFNNQLQKIQSHNGLSSNSQEPINNEWRQQTRRQRDIQQQKKKEQQKMQAQELYAWIAEQMAADDSQQERIVSQSFQISLYPYGVYNFRWNPPKSQVLHLKVMVFELNDDKDITLMKQNEKDEYIEVSYRNEWQAKYTQLGRVYIQKSFKFNFDTDYKYFKLYNNMDRNLILIVDLQKLNEVVLPQGRVKNDHFSAMTSKLIAIDNEVTSGEKLRQHSYKYQWGFLQNQYTHDSRLLGLTGLELLIIIAAAVVQVYFIKALLDNRAIV